MDVTVFAPMKEAELVAHENNARRAIHNTDAVYDTLNATTRMTSEIRRLQDLVRHLGGDPLRDTAPESEEKR